MAQDRETARVTAIKAELVSTTNTQGWQFIKQLAGNIVTRNINEALEEEDSAKRDTKVLKASALRKGFADLFNAIESVKEFSEQSEEADDFASLDFETAAKQSAEK
jgi:hypothetical protein